MSDPLKPHDALPHDQRRARRPDTTATLRRSRDRLIGGVLGGVAEYVGADPRLLRALFAAATVVTGGVLALVYALLWALLPAPA